MIDALPLILGSVGGSLRDLSRATRPGADSVASTEHDLPMWMVMVGITRIGVGDRRLAP